MWDLLRLRRRIERGCPPVTAVPRTQKMVFPQSPAQRRLWRLTRTGLPYNITVSGRLSGVLDLAALHAALRVAVGRHEALRTIFPDDATQLVLSKLEPEFAVCEAVDIGAEQWARQEALRALDPVTGPLTRLAVLVIGRDEHLFVLAVHHIVADGWSIDLLIRDVNLSYARIIGIGTGAAELAPVALHLGDFVHWQRGWLTGETLERYRTFWRGQLPADPTELPLAPDRSPDTPTFAGARHIFAIAEERAQRIRKLAGGCGTTPFVVLLAAFQAVLARRSGRREIVLATPAANRGRRELDGIVGMLMNIVPLRTQLDPDWTFRELVAAVHETVTTALAHQAMPIELALAGDTLAAAGMFSVGGVSAIELDLPGVTLSPFELSVKDTEFALNLTVMDDGAGAFFARLSYHTDRYDASTIESLADEFAGLLAREARS